MSVPAVEALAAIQGRLDLLVERLTRPAVLTAHAPPAVAERLLGEPLDLLAGVLPRRGAGVGDGPDDSIDDGTDDSTDDSAAELPDRPARRLRPVPGTAGSTSRGTGGRRRPSPAPASLAGAASGRRVTAVPLDAPTRSARAGDVPPDEDGTDGVPGAPSRSDDRLLGAGEPGVAERLRAGDPVTGRPAGGPDGARSGPDRLGSERVGADRLGGERVGAERVGADRVGARPADPWLPDRVAAAERSIVADTGVALRVRHDPGSAAAVLRANLAAAVPATRSARPPAPSERPGGPAVRPAADPNSGHPEVGHSDAGHSDAGRPYAAGSAIDPLTAASMDELYAAVADRLRLDVLRAYGTTEG